MKKNINLWSNKVISTLKSNPVFYLLLSVLLLVAFFVRTYRLSDLLGFYYDQGRDALVIWKFIHDGRPFLVGPVTGLEGIFLGPFFYYLITPFYFLGQGDPVYPAAFLGFISTCAIYMVYVLGKEFHSKASGMIAAVITSFSYYIILAGRWLSNPTPIMFTSILLLFCMWKLLNSEKQKWWIAISLITGLSLQLESASAVFFLPVLLVFALWLFLKSSTRNSAFPKGKVFVVSASIFLLTLLPQVLFNFRHENLLFDNAQKIFLEGGKGGGFKLSFWEILPIRLTYFWEVFSSKILPGRTHMTTIFTFISLLGLVISKDKLFKSKALPLLLTFLIIPMIGYIFFQGNYGNIYDYYMTGYYLPMILLFSVGLGAIWCKGSMGKIVVIGFFLSFLFLNLTLTKNYLSAGVDGPTHITLGNQLQGVNWIFEDSKGRGEFNVNIYVPPVIPHSYDYLFKWQGYERCGNNLCGMLTDKNVETLYTLYEEDPPHPERLESWLSVYKNTTFLEDEESFGGVTVQRRRRLN